MPPATPKLARAPDGVPVIHPPPVTKSPTGGVHAAQLMSACAEEITTSASVRPLMISPASSELPLALAVPLPSQVASASDRSRSAWMEFLATVRLTLATD